MRGGGPSVDLGIERMVTLKIELQEIGLGKVVRINLALDREKLRAAVNTSMNFLVP
jgi:hypothetical protein